MYYHLLSINTLKHTNHFSSIVRSVLASIFFIVFTVYPKNDSYIGIKKFSIDPDASEYYKSIDILLFQRLSFELLPRGIKPILLENESVPNECVAIASGSIEILANKPILYFTIVGLSASDEETKKIPLENQSADAIIDIMAIKVRHFLEQTVSGKLRVASVPLDCDILLDGIRIGKTPAELLLEQGQYSIQLQREFLATYYDSVTVFPGRETVLSVTMEFKGHALKPWIVSALIFTGCTVISRIIELQFHNDYKNLENVLDEDNTNKKVVKSEFDQKFNRYQIANAITIGLLIPTATTWTIAGYHFWGNRSLKKRIFLEH